LDEDKDSRNINMREYISISEVMFSFSAKRGVQEEKERGGAVLVM